MCVHVCNADILWLNAWKDRFGGCHRGQQMGVRQWGSRLRLWPPILFSTLRRHWGPDLLTERKTSHPTRSEKCKPRPTNFMSLVSWSGMRYDCVYVLCVAAIGYFSTLLSCYYPRRRRDTVLPSFVCLSVCLSVCLLFAQYLKNWCS